MTRNPSKASARRWLDERVGQDIDTVQVKPSGLTWEPGARTLTRQGNTFLLDGSQCSITSNHVVTECDDSRLVVEWQDEDGVRIHSTIYTVCL
jgi:hypothetical protein